MKPTLAPTAAHAFWWSFLGEAATRLTTPAITLALAFVLAPVPSGLVAAAEYAQRMGCRCGRLKVAARTGSLQSSPRSVIQLTVRGITP